MNILITGGCGFIGSHFAEYWLGKYPLAHVVCVDLMTYAASRQTLQNLQNLAPERFHFIQEDICNFNLSSVVAGFQIGAVLNFAAESHVDRSILDAASFVRTNVMGVQNLLGQMPHFKGCRFLQVSTDEVYGALGPESPTSSELSVLDPNSPYAATKASADLLALAMARTHNLDLVITRCTNNYGSRQFPEKLIPLVIANAMENKSIPIYGDGRQIRDWIHVLDHVRGIEAALLKGRSLEIYNLGSGSEQKNIDLVTLILKIMGQSTELMKSVGDRPAHDRRYGLNCEKSRRELEWEPKINLTSGLEQTVEWYQTHESWWRELRNQKYENYYKANYQDKMLC